jgi:hypothetical protein
MKPEDFVVAELIRWDNMLTNEFGGGQLTEHPVFPIARAMADVVKALRSLADSNTTILTPLSAPYYEALKRALDHLDSLQEGD